MSDFERKFYAYRSNTHPMYAFQDKYGVWRKFDYLIVAGLEQKELINDPYYAKFNDSVKDVIDPIKYYELINKEAKIPLSLKPEDICFPYVIWNETLKNYIGTGGTYLKLQDIVKMTDETRDIMKNIEDKEIIITDEFVKKNKTFRQEFEKELAERRRFEELRPIPLEEMTIDTIVKVYEISPEFILGNIYTLFDKIKVSVNVPLVITQKFYKILKGHEYDLEIPDESNTLFLFTVRGKVEITEKEESFEISYEFKKEEDDTEYLELICDTLGVSRKDVVLGSERYNGVSFFPSQTLSNIIWRDFVMNDPIASKYLYMDEHQMGIKGRDSKRQIVRKGFYVFYTEGDTKTSLSIREDDINQGVRIRILNAISFEKAYVILRMMAKLFALYNESGSRIANEYNSILKSNLIEFKAPEYRQVQDSQTKLKKIAKDMFVPNYTRKCQYLPKIIPESEVARYKEKHQVMRFPKIGDEVEGKAYHFGCGHHETHIYPGLRKNPFDNKTDYPILPCCYTKDQRDRRTSLFKDYYDSDKKLGDFVPSERQEVKNIQYRFLISDKFVGFEQTGKCPSDIDNLFMLYSDSKPVRKGVHRTRQSALECVLLITKYKNFPELDSESRLRVLESELKRLEQMDLTICAQECWDIENPKTLIDSDRYLNPRYLFRLLETVYGCRIVLFSREDFIQPNHIEGYLRWSTNSTYPVVMMYEHMGSEADQATYPQCELILLEKENPSVSEWIYKDYLSSLSTIQTTRVKAFPSEEFFVNGFLPEYTITEQHIDFYGKMYALNVRDPSGKYWTLYFEQDRFPVLKNIPKTTVGYFSERGKRMFQLNGYSIRILEKRELSLLEQYDQTRKQMELLVENAKRIYASRSREDWSWIEVNPNVKLDYSKYLFSSANRVVVPNEETKRRLQYYLRVYSTRYRSALMQYPTMKNIIPFQYRSIHDFEEQENAVIVEIPVEIRWFSNFYRAKTLDGILYDEPFVTVIQNRPYKCNPIEKPEGDSYSVFVPQFQKIFKVGDKPVRQFLVLKNPENQIQYYECLSF